MNVKQYGLQRSGTNAVRFLLESNYDVKILVHEHGWKHGPFRRGPFHGLVVSVKHPLAWLPSFYWYARYTKGRQIDPMMSFSDFLVGQYAYDEGDFVCDNPVAYWNVMTRHWTRVPCGVPRAIVRFEDLLDDERSCVDGAAAALGLARRDGDFVGLPGTRIRAGCNEPVRDLVTNMPFDKAYYTDGGYMGRYTEEDMAFIRENIDHELMSGLGYSSGTRPCDPCFC